MIHLKSEFEIDRMRAPADLVGRTLGVVACHIQAGVTTAELDGVAEEFIRAHGAVPAFKGYRVGKQIFPATLCTSINDVVVHGIPGETTLCEGDVVSVDCGVMLDGYYGDSAFTFAVGEISEENYTLCRITFESLLRGVDKAITGNRLGDIGWAVQELCERHGFGVVRDLVGHGIGQQLHEEPQVPNFGRPGNGRKLKEDLVICIEPMINRGGPGVKTDPDGWTVRTADGMPSAHYEHMVVVRNGSAEVLTTFSHVEEVLDFLPYKTTAEA